MRSKIASRTAQIESCGDEIDSCTDQIDHGAEKIDSHAHGIGPCGGRSTWCGEELTRANERSGHRSAESTQSRARLIRAAQILACAFAEWVRGAAKSTHTSLLIIVRPPFQSEHNGMINASFHVFFEVFERLIKIVLDSFCRETLRCPTSRCLVAGIWPFHSGPPEEGHVYSTRGGMARPP